MTYNDSLCKFQSQKLFCIFWSLGNFPPQCCRMAYQHKCSVVSPHLSRSPASVLNLRRLPWAGNYMLDHSAHTRPTDESASVWICIQYVGYCHCTLLHQLRTKGNSITGPWLWKASEILTGKTAGLHHCNPIVSLTKDALASYNYTHGHLHTHRHFVQMKYTVVQSSAHKATFPGPNHLFSQPVAERKGR